MEVMTAELNNQRPHHIASLRQILLFGGMSRSIEPGGIIRGVEGDLKS